MSLVRDLRGKVGDWGWVFEVVRSVVESNPTSGILRYTRSFLKQSKIHKISINYREWVPANAAEEADERDYST